MVLIRYLETDRAHFHLRPHLYSNNLVRLKTKQREAPFWHCSGLQNCTRKQITSIEKTWRRGGVKGVKVSLQPKPRMLVWFKGYVTRVLIHTRSGLADARVGNKIQLHACSSMFEHGEISAVALDY